jgi:hypothetical protein
MNRAQLRVRALARRPCTIEISGARAPGPRSVRWARRKTLHGRWWNAAHVKFAAARAEKRTCAPTRCASSSRFAALSAEKSTRTASDYGACRVSDASRPCSPAGRIRRARAEKSGEIVTPVAGLLVTGVSGHDTRLTSRRPCVRALTLHNQNHPPVVIPPSPTPRYALTPAHTRS